MTERKVKKVVTGIHTQDGAGVKLLRVIGNNDVEDFDPFLMLDAFDSKNPDDYTKGFPWHPHRGIETVTYLIKGDIEHGDSIGNKGSILDGSAQWMTAGSGIIHQEMPKASEHMLGVQLWINLPQKYKMAEPEYNGIEPNMIPKVEGEGAKVGIISGEYKGVHAPTQGKYVKATYLDVDLQPDTEWEFENDPKNTLFIYIVQGSLESAGEAFENRRAVLFGEGEKLWVKSGARGARFLMLTAKPLKEPVAWGGPIVMNTREELAQAFDELNNGTFEKKKS